MESRKSKRGKVELDAEASSGDLLMTGIVRDISPEGLLFEPHYVVDGAIYSDPCPHDFLKIGDKIQMKIEGWDEPVVCIVRWFGGKVGVEFAFAREDVKKHVRAVSEDIEISLMSAMNIENVCEIALLRYEAWSAYWLFEQDITNELDTFNNLDGVLSQIANFSQSALSVQA